MTSSQRLRVLANDWLLEVHLGALKRVVVDRRFAAKAVKQFSN